MDISWICDFSKQFFGLKSVNYVALQTKKQLMMKKGEMKDYLVLFLVFHFNYIYIYFFSSSSMIKDYFFSAPSHALNFWKDRIGIEQWAKHQWWLQLEAKFLEEWITATQKLKKIHRHLSISISISISFSIFISVFSDLCVLNALM